MTDFSSISWSDCLKDQQTTVCEYLSGTVWLPNRKVSAPVHFWAWDLTISTRHSNHTIIFIVKKVIYNLWWCTVKEQLIILAQIINILTFSPLLHATEARVFLLNPSETWFLLKRNLLIRENASLVLFSQTIQITILIKINSFCKRIY